MEDLKKLLAAATQGPWKIERGKRCIQGPDTRDGDPLVLTSMMGGATKWSHSPYSEYCVPGIKEGDANAALIVAAVNALPELLALREERADIVGRDLEFARMADGTIKVGYNPRTEEGGWTLIGDVTKAVTAIEAQRDNALRDLDAANQLVIRARAALKETGQ